MKQKYNFDKIQLEYFSSPIKEVKEFFQCKYHTYTSHIKLKTKWWHIEKQKMIRNVRIEAQKEMEQELRELYKPTIEELSQMHKAVLTVIKWKLYHLAQNITKDDFGNIILPDDLDVREVALIWKIIKSELYDINKIENRKSNNNIWKIVLV